MIERGYSPENIKKVLDSYGYRASLSALRAYARKNPSIVCLVVYPDGKEYLSWCEKRNNQWLIGEDTRAAYPMETKIFVLSNEKIYLLKGNRLIFQDMDDGKFFVQRNPACKSAGMTPAKRKEYNKKHGSHVKKGVTNIASMDKLRRWGAWATRFYGRKVKAPLVKGKHYTPLSCSAIAWGNNPPANWREAEKIYRRGKEALDTYKTLKDKYGYSPKQRFTTKERNFLNRAFLDFVK